MADIRTTLGLDDRQYQQGIRRAGQSATQFGNTHNQQMDKAVKGTNNLGKANTQLEGGFKKLGAAIAGIGIGALLKNIGTTANQLINLSQAVGISTARFMEMQTAAIGAGISSTDLSARVSDLTKNLEEAANGNVKVQAAMRTVGMSFDDIKNKTPDELFNQVAVSLAKIEDPAKRAATAAALLGERARRMDWRSYADGIVSVSGKMDDLAKAQEEAAAISDRLQQFVSMVKMQFTALLSPIMNLLMPTTNLGKTLDAAGVAAKVLAGALALVVTSGVIQAVRSIATAWAAVSGALKYATVTTVAKTAADAHAATAAAFNAKSNDFLAGAISRVGRSTAAVAKAEAHLALLRSTSAGPTIAIANAEKALSLARREQIINNEVLAKTQAELAIRTGVSTSATTANTAATTANTTAKGANAAATTAMGTASVGAAAGVNTLSAASLTLTARLKAAALLAGKVVGVFAALALVARGAGEGEDAMVDMSRRVGEEVSKLNPEALQRYFDIINEGKSSMEALAIVAPEALARLRTDPFSARSAPDTGTGSVASVLDPMAEARVRTIMRETEQLQFNNARVRERINLEVSLANASKTDREARLAGFDAETNKLNQKRAIVQKINDLLAQQAITPAREAEIQAEIEAYGAQLDIIDSLHDGIEGLKRAEGERADALIKSEAERADALEMSNHFADLQKKGQEAILDVHHQIQDLTATSDQQRLNAIDRMIEGEKKLALEKRRSQLGGGELSTSETEAIIAKVKASYGGLRSANEELIRQSRTWETGWKKAMNTYVDEATNGAKKAEAIFGKAFKGMEDLLVNFAKTGKFEWKSFVAMMLEELLRAQIQAIFAGMIGNMKDAFSGSASGMLGGLFSGGGQQGGGGIMDMIGGLFGGGQKESGDPLGDFINKLPGMGGQTQEKSSGGVWDAIKGFGGSVVSGVTNAVKGIGSTVGSVVSGVTNVVKSIGGTIGSVVKGIGSFFGGFFADGGHLGAGKWGIAGERGPEIIRGPANVDPDMGTSGGTVNHNYQVSYNISAVDAMSFKQLVARDPGFIHGVVMAGAKSIPGRR